MCRPTVTMPGGEPGTLGGQGQGCSPASTNIYGEPPCARRCAGRWGHREERGTLSSPPCSSPLSQGPVPEPSTGRREGWWWWQGAGCAMDRIVWRKARPGSLEIRTPGFMSSIPGPPNLRYCLASVSPLEHEGVQHDDPSSPDAF